jgi:hypothetical protein
VGGGNLTGYATTANGLPLSKPYFPVRTKFDVTTRPYYVAGMKTASWSAFYDLVINPGYPSITFSAPTFYPNNTLVGVISVSRPLSKFTDILKPYAGRARISYIIDANYNLVGTSRNETVWLSTNQLKPSKSSTSYLVRESVAYLKLNAIRNTDTFTIVSPSTKETLMVSTREWSDSSATLNWMIVVVDTPFSGPASSPTPAPVAIVASSDINNEDIQAARQAATAAAFLSALVLILTLAMAFHVLIRPLLVTHGNTAAVPMSKREEI